MTRGASPHAKSSKSPHKETKSRRPTREELLLRLQILGPVTNPLPATLPPSPPASRSPSPVRNPSPSSSKRKLEDGESSRHSSSSTHKRQRSTPQAPLTPPRDGQRETAAPGRATTVASPSAAVFPVARPRKGRKPEGFAYGPTKDKYMEYGRLFKRSADARINTYCRPESSAFCVLKNRPAQGTPYAKHDRMMSRFEALDGVLCFAYAQWYGESSSNKPDMMWWNNSASYFDLARQKHMEGFANPGPREDALLGIHFLVDAYWKAHYAWHYLKYNVDRQVSSLLYEHQKSPATNKSSPASDVGQQRESSAQLGPARNATTGAQLQPTPPSTGLSPAGAQPLVSGTGAGDHTATSRSPAVVPQLDNRSLKFSEDLARQIQTGSKLTIASGDSLLFASQKINLTVLEKHFPRTFLRASKSTLKWNEEWEIDFEDDESELFWPLGPTRGEGLGWVLALGRSMLREYASEFGYRGIDGTCKPEDISYPNRK